MSIDTEASIYKKSAIEFKSTSFSVPVLVISSTELKQIEHYLEEKIAQAPEFFKNSPLLIDLQDCNRQENAIDLNALVKSLYTRKLIPIGITGGNDEQNSLALELNIPVHALRGTNSINSSSLQKLSPEQLETSTKKSSDEEEITPTVENMLISLPIRSGQRIYTKGDLTILSHVSAGAEVMAEGNIHIYGALRGRALAGVQGDTESRIFCSSLQAELVSIAGHYKVSENIEKTRHNKPTQVFLQNQTIIVKTL